MGREEIEKTLGYYEREAISFAQGTQGVDFKENQEKFLRLLFPGGKILDFGCGAGRDTKYFLERGYQVEATDGSPEMVKIASAFAGIPVRLLLFQELKEESVYDGIWACSSILHLPRRELWQVMEKMRRALKPGGVIYTSFKYGEGEKYRGERFFIDYTEESFGRDLKAYSSLVLCEYWISCDVRPGREEEKWLNLLLRNERG